jgi:hypothetical protein
MALTIPATAPVAHAAIQPPLAVGAAARIAAPSSPGAGSASSAQQKAALNQLLAKYKYDLTRGAPTSTLSALGRQITAAAKAAGQRVTLPRAAGGAATTLATAPANTEAAAGKVNVTA